MRIKTLGKVLITSSPLVFVANFLTLANNLFTKSEWLHSLGGAVAVVCFLSFLIGLLMLVIGKIKEKPKEGRERVGTLSKIKLILALAIFLWLLIIFPIMGLSHVGLLQAADFSDLGNTIGSLVILSFAVLTQYLVPPFGLGVIPLFFGGLYLLLFRKTRWALDVLVLVVTIAAFSFMLSLAIGMSK